MSRAWFKTWLLPVALAVFVVSLATGCRKNGTADSATAQPVGESYPMRFTDDAGRAIFVKTRPASIVSLAPSVTKIVCALGRADSLKGVTKWCDDPAAAKVEKIGTMSEPDVERILTIHPDIVIGTEMTPRHIYDTLQAAGVTCVLFKHQSLADVLDDMRSISTLIGEDGRGAAKVDALEARRKAIVAALPPDRSPVKVALLYDLDSMGSAGRGSWVDDMLRSVRLDNIANRAQSSWPRLSREALLTEQPRFILLPLSPDANEAAALRQRVESLKADPVWGKVDAVREGRVLLVPENMLNIPGPGIVDAMEYLAKAVYGG